MQEICRDRWAKEGLTFRRREVDDVAIFLEHVHLLDGLNRLDVELFEGAL